MPLRPPPNQSLVTTERNEFRPTWQEWFQAVFRLTSKIRDDGSLEMAVLSDAQASNNTLYYSTTQGKLCYKDTSGVVNDLY